MNRGAFDLWKTLPRALPYVRPYRRLLVLSFVLTLLSAAVTLAEPWPLAIIVDNVLGDRSLGGPLAAIFGSDPDQYTLLAFAVAGGFTVTFATHGMTVLMDWVTAKLEQKMVLDLRSDLFEHTQGLSLTFHDGRMTGQLMNQINMQAAAMGVIIVAFPPIAQAALTLIGMFVVVTLIDWQVALVSLVAVPFIWYSLGLYGRRVVPRLQRVQALEWQSLSIVHEAMSMLRVIVAFGRERHEHARFRGQGEVAVDERVKLTIRQTLFSLAVSSATAVGTGAVLGVGALHVIQGQITVGELLVLIAYVAAVYQPLEQISNTIGDLNDQFVQFNSSLNLLDVKKEVEEAPDALDIGRARGAVAFEHVDFAYKGRSDTLSDVTFCVEPGQRVAIVGPTGAGKTTLISLLIRYYDPHGGRVVIDGHDIRDLTLKSLREQISVVLQEPLLFSGTIADNIRYGKLDASMDEVIAAAKAANAHDFIMGLPKGYETELGERGAQLSGGERQRVSVARAFIKDGPILILDEPTSSIDSRTEGVILDALEDLMVGRTSFMIAHRLSTIRDADLILVLRDGRLVQQGTHEELVEVEGAYRELYEAQNRPRTRRLARRPAAAAASAGSRDVVVPHPAGAGRGGGGDGPALSVIVGSEAAHPPRVAEEPDEVVEAPGDAAAGEPPPPARRHRTRRVAATLVGLASLAAAAAAAALVLGRDGDEAPALPAVARPVGVDRVVVGGVPTGVAVARGSAYVSRSRSLQLARVDLDEFHRADASYTVPPWTTDIAAGHGALWVTAVEPATVTRIDLDTDRSVTRRLPPGTPVVVVATPSDVWVGLRSSATGRGPGSVARVDAATGRVRQVVPVPAGVHTLTVDRGTLWVANRAKDTVTRIDTRTGRPTPLSAGRAPAGVATGAGAAWVANAGDGTVTRLAERAGWRSVVTVGGEPRGIAYAAGAVWVAGFRSARLSQIDPVTGVRIGRPLRLSRKPTKVAAGRDAIYVVSQNRLQRVRFERGSGG